MPERAIFLDRDNTIIDNNGYLGDPAGVKLLQGAATAIASLRRLGYRIVVVSNQSGVARGMFDEAAVEAVNQEMCKQLREQAGAHIDASYYCPYHPDALVPEYKMDHDWRKPKPGMLKQAAEDFNLDLAQSWVIGDMPRDIAAGASAGCRTILLKDPDHPAPAHATDALAASPNFIVKNLADAARIVVREGRGPIRDAVPVPLGNGAVLAAAELANPSSPNSTALTKAATPMTNPAPDAPAMAEQLTQKSAHPHSSGLGAMTDLRPVLEEILSHLRHRTRAVDAPPSFTLARMVAVILQMIVIFCLVLATWDFVTWPASTNPQSFYWDRWTMLLSAGDWLLGGIVLQGIVIALHIGEKAHR